MAGELASLYSVRSTQGKQPFDAHFDATRHVPAAKRRDHEPGDDVLRISIRNVPAHADSHLYAHCALAGCDGDQDPVIQALLPEAPAIGDAK
jgi:hypothetical protein